MIKFAMALITDTTIKGGTHILRRAHVGWTCLRTVRQRGITKLPTRGTVPIRTLGWPHCGVRIAVLLGAALVVAPAPVLAEMQVSGTPKAVRIEARDAPLAEILAALNRAFGVHYQLSVNLDKRLTGTYEGSLTQVLTRILNGYKFGMYTDNGAMVVTVAGTANAPGASPGRPGSSSAQVVRQLSTAALQARPSTAAPQPMPSTAAPQPIPSTAAPEPMPSTAAPQPTPSTAAPQPIPSTAASQPRQSRAASQPRPSRGLPP
jgi:hypothetical protein